MCGTMGSKSAVQPSTERELYRQTRINVNRTLRGLLVVKWKFQAHWYMWQYLCWNRVACLSFSPCTVGFMKAVSTYLSSRSVAHLVLSHGNRRSWVVSFAFLPQENNPLCPENRMLDGDHCRCECFGEDKKSWSCRESKDDVSVVRPDFEYICVPSCQIISKANYQWQMETLFIQIYCLGGEKLEKGIWCSDYESR